jgi:hypothetical protein
MRCGARERRPYAYVYTHDTRARLARAYASHLHPHALIYIIRVVWRWTYIHVYFTFIIIRLNKQFELLALCLAEGVVSKCVPRSRARKVSRARLFGPRAAGTHDRTAAEGGSASPHSRPASRTSRCWPTR